MKAPRSPSTLTPSHTRGVCNSASQSSDVEHPEAPTSLRAALAEVGCGALRLGQLPTGLDALAFMVEERTVFIAQEEPREPLSWLSLRPLSWFLSLLTTSPLKVVALPPVPAPNTVNDLKQVVKDDLQLSLSGFYGALMLARTELERSAGEDAVVTAVPVQLDAEKHVADLKAEEAMAKRIAEEAMTKRIAEVILGSEPMAEILGPMEGTVRREEDGSLIIYSRPQAAAAAAPA